MTTTCLLTTGHRTFDRRIFHKEAKSLVEYDYDVKLIAHADENTTRDGVDIISLGDANSRIDRIKHLGRAYKFAYNTDADIYHFHDPELLTVGAALSKRTNAKVIFDAHEDYGRRGVYRRPWIPPVAKEALRYIYPPTQAQFARQLDAVITTTEHIANDFYKRNYPNVTIIRNFPITERMDIGSLPIKRDHEYVLVYVGGLAEARGLMKMIETLYYLRNMGIDVGLWLIGPFESNEENNKQKVNNFLQENNLSNHVRLFGYIPHENIFSYLSGADIGLSLVDQKQFEFILPTKIFEYMYTELPVVATDTGPSRKYVTEEYGILVGEDPEHIASSIADLMTKDQLNEMGAIGREKVLSEYNWEQEAARLNDLYTTLLE